MILIITIREKIISNNDELRLFSKTDSADMFQMNKLLYLNINVCHLDMVQVGVPDERTISKLPQNKSCLLYSTQISKVPIRKVPSRKKMPMKL
jgi:hypothetical protein